MLIGYARVSKSDGSQTTDLQTDALLTAGVKQEYIYQDYASGKRDDRPGLQNWAPLQKREIVYYLYNTQSK